MSSVSQSISTWKIDAVLKSQPPRYRHQVAVYEQCYLIGVLRGRLFFDDDRGSAEVIRGRLAVLRPGSRFTLHTESDGYSGVAVEVRESHVELLGGLSAVTDPSPRIEMLCEWIEAELLVPSAASAQTLQHLAPLLLDLGLRETAHLPAGEPHIARAQYWARRAREAIENSLYAAIGVQELLGRFPVSYRQLTRYVRDEFGVSPKDLQSRARIAEAQRLLRETGWSVTTIALELGFASTQHFVSAFRQRVGTTPGSWRGRGEPG